MADLSQVMAPGQGGAWLGSGRILEDIYSRNFEQELQEEGLLRKNQLEATAQAGMLDKARLANLVAKEELGANPQMAEQRQMGRDLDTRKAVIQKSLSAIEAAELGELDDDDLQDILGKNILTKLAQEARTKIAPMDLKDVSDPAVPARRQAFESRFESIRQMIEGKDWQGIKGQLRKALMASDREGYGKYLMETSKQNEKDVGDTVKTALGYKPTSSDSGAAYARVNSNVLAILERRLNNIQGKVVSDLNNTYKASGLSITIDAANEIGVKKTAESKLSDSEVARIRQDIKSQYQPQVDEAYLQYQTQLRKVMGNETLEGSTSTGVVRRAPVKQETPTSEKKPVTPSSPRLPPGVTVKQ